ncbi:MAG: 2-C-methyl-D-erythritol 4-phosphate cytidylyltransferase [Peptococcaceae bacterium]
MFNTVVIIVAAGQGKRMGAHINKQYLKLLDRPVLAYSLEAFESHPFIQGMIIVAKEDEIPLCREEILGPYKFSKVMDIVPGGKERQDSVWAGIKALPDECELVVVHDGARPLITPDIITNTHKAARETGAAIAAVPVKETIKRVSLYNNVIRTIPRQELWSVQTPQVFKKDILVAAYENAHQKGIRGTDDASLVESIRKEVKVVMGSYENIKITTPEDLTLGASILQRRK